MTTGLLILVLAISVILIGVVLVLVFGLPHRKPHTADKYRKQYEQVGDEVARVFNDEFREELRNHGRLYFNKIIGENAMFLQQDLRLTTSQINESMRGEIGRKLQDEFAAYEQSMKDAQAMATEALQKTLFAAEEQRAKLEAEMATVINQRKDELLQHFENNMAEIINHYLAEAFGSKINLDEQIGYILGEMEANKEAMKQDMYL